MDLFCFVSFCFVLLKQLLKHSSLATARDFFVANTELRVANDCSFCSRITMADCNFDAVLNGDSRTLTNSHHFNLMEEQEKTSYQRK